MLDTKKRNEEIVEELEENSRKIENLKYVSNTLEGNFFENKFMLGLGFGALAWFSLMLTFDLISGLVPIELMCPLYIGVSTLIGIAGQKVAYKLTGCTDKIKEVCSKVGTKNKKKLLEENVRYELEKEKLDTRNKVLEIVSNQLETISTYANSYEDISEEHLQDRINDKTSTLEDEYKKLDVEVTKKYLAERFSFIRRNSLEKDFDYVINGTFGFFVLCTWYTMPALASSSHFGFLEMFVPGVIGAAATIVYSHEKNKANTEVFNKINDELGDDKLPQYKEKDEKETLNNLVLKASQNTCNTRLALEKSKIDLENMEEMNKKKISETRDYKKSLINAIERYLPMSYSEFKSLELDEQQRVINQIKEEQGRIGKDKFQQKIDHYINQIEEFVPETKTVIKGNSKVKKRYSKN